MCQDCWKTIMDGTHGLRKQTAAVVVACGSLPGVTIAFRPRNHPRWQDQDQPHFTEEETELSGSPVPGVLCTHSQRQECPRKRPPLTKAGGQRASGGESDGVREDRARQGCEQAWAQSWEGPDPQASGDWDPESLGALAMKE